MSETTEETFHFHVCINLKTVLSPFIISELTIGVVPHNVNYNYVTNCYKREKIS